MGRGQWSRWGRDSCVGFSLSLGDLIAGSVVKKGDAWEATIGTVPIELPKGSSKFEAMKAVEQCIETRMSFALEEWAIYLARKERAQRPQSDPERGNL